MSLFRSHWTVEGISLNARNAAIRAAEADGEELGIWLSRLINKVSAEERQALASDEEAAVASNAGADFSDDANTDAGLEESPDTFDQAPTDEAIDDSATNAPAPNARLGRATRSASVRSCTRCEPSGVVRVLSR